jgi:hypothetical protein
VNPVHKIWQTFVEVLPYLSDKFAKTLLLQYIVKISDDNVQLFTD